MNANFRFSGFPVDTLRFFQDLEANNRKEWFETNKVRYEESVLLPAKSFVMDLGTRLQEIQPDLAFDATKVNGSGSIFRIHRDTRFSKDKRPYKTNLGMLFWLQTGQRKKECPHFYVGIYPKGYLLHCGFRKVPANFLRAFRQAVSEPELANELKHIMNKLEKAGLELAQPTRARVPRGWPSDHPSADLLRMDELWAKTNMSPASHLKEKGFVTRCVRKYRQIAPLLQWISKVESGA